jgi:Fe-Mn family superoxide dismutase
MATLAAQKIAKSISLSPLPYPEDALVPVISARTLSLHHGKHHKAYVDKVNELVQGTELEGQSLERIVMATSGKSDKTELFNNAAQAWNHDFYWRSLKPKGGGKPGAALAEKINASRSSSPRRP